MMRTFGVRVIREGQQVTFPEIQNKKLGYKVNNFLINKAELVV
jgi:hypothetical protein